MSEMGGPPPQDTGGNFFTRKIGGLPGWVWLLGALAAGYFLLSRGSSGAGTGASSSGGGGTSTTGDITLTPGTTTVDTGGPSDITNPAPVSGNEGGSGDGSGDVDQPSQSGVPNPQPHPSPPPRKKTVAHKITHKAVPHEEFVTVAKWPGKSVNGLAQWNTTLWGIAKHSGTSVQELLKLNPNIKNANLIYPGQRIRIK